MKTQFPNIKQQFPIAGSQANCIVLFPQRKENFACTKSVCANVQYSSNRKQKLKITGGSTGGSEFTHTQSLKLNLCSLLFTLKELTDKEKASYQMSAIPLSFESNFTFTKPFFYSLGKHLQKCDNMFLAQLHHYCYFPYFLIYNCTDISYLTGCY